MRENSRDSRMVVGSRVGILGFVGLAIAACFAVEVPGYWFLRSMTQLSIGAAVAASYVAVQASELKGVKEAAFFGRRSLDAVALLWLQGWPMPLEVKLLLATLIGLVASVQLSRLLRSGDKEDWSLML